jgi:hypothetical protein
MADKTFTPTSSSRAPIAEATAAAAAASGACAFIMTSAASQAAQLALGVHTGSRILGMRLLPSLFGACTITLASIASVEVAALGAAAAVAVSTGRDLNDLRHAHASVSHASSALLGSACFLALGGRFWAVSPSGLSTLGAYANTARASLPATLAYASGPERAAIQEFGRKFGCHSCGARPWRLTAAITGGTRLRYNADHMPPLAEVGLTRSPSTVALPTYHCSCARAHALPYLAPHMLCCPTTPAAGAAGRSR